MTRITRVLAVPGVAGFYADDLAAIKAGAERDGAFYRGDPLTPGFSQIRQPGESISIVLILDDGQIAWGDAVVVQHSGVAGRDGPFSAAAHIATAEAALVPTLCDRRLSTFRGHAAEIEELTYENAPLHRALQYGATQAILDAVSKATGRTMAEVIADEFGTAITTSPVPIFAQSGEDRHNGADKMIARRVGALPHGLFNSLKLVGKGGKGLSSYLAWLRNRISELAGPAYRPTIHVDVYGVLTAVFNGDPNKIADYLLDLEELVLPYSLRVEAPIASSTKADMQNAMASLRTLLQARSASVEIVVDEWCNTLEDIRSFADAGAADMIQIKTPDLGSVANSIEAVGVCHSAGLKAYLGGSSNTTDKSSQVTAHIALATGADLILNQPGMGVDEGVMIVTNEMARTLAIISSRTAQAEQP